MRTEAAGTRVAVFGGSSGIGAAVVRQLARFGAAVTAVSRSADRLRRALAGTAGVTIAAVDAREDDSLREFFDHHGSFDHVVVSLVSKAYFGPFAALSPQALRDSLDGKLVPYVNVARHAAACLPAGGSITWITGLAARRSTRSGAALAAVNGALEGMLPTLAVELAPRRINAVSPGPTDTEAWDRIPAETRRLLADEAAATTPLGRMATADDVADAVVAVMTSPFVTGAVIPCDGGRHL